MVLTVARCAFVIFLFLSAWFLFTWFFYLYEEELTALILDLFFSFLQSFVPPTLKECVYVNPFPLLSQSLFLVFNTSLFFPPLGNWKISSIETPAVRIPPCTPHTLSGDCRRSRAIKL